jgi:hypothetical protein
MVQIRLMFCADDVNMLGEKVKVKAIPVTGREGP